MGTEQNKERIPLLTTALWSENNQSYTIYSDKTIELDNSISKEDSFTKSIHTKALVINYVLEHEKIDQLKSKVKQLTHDKYHIVNQLLDEYKKHELKTYPALFQDVKSGAKTFEIRKFDRDFKQGDLLLLREWNPNTKEYTGNDLLTYISYITSGDPIPEGYCAMSIKKVAIPFNEDEY